MHVISDAIDIDTASASASVHAAPMICAEDGLSVFLGARTQLFRIAYRILHSVAEAEDVLHDVWVRWQTTDRSAIRNPLAFLMTVTRHLALNVLQSARRRREVSTGEHLPEPIDTSHDPEVGTELREALELAILVLLQKLSPAERAAYVLREAFSYPYRRIAGILRVTEANARQLVTRAREHVSGGRRAPVSPTARRGLHGAFVVASRTGDLTGLERLLASEVRSRADNDGAAGRAAGRPSRPRQARLRRRAPLPSWRDNRDDRVSVSAWEAMRVTNRDAALSSTHDARLAPGRF